MRAAVRGLPVILAAWGVAAAPLPGQYRLTAPSGETLEFEPDALLALRAFSDSLRDDLERDPHVLYFTDFGRVVEEPRASAAMPWNAMEVVTDSSTALLMPGNLREAGRAYINYAVLRMHAVRQDPDVPCAELAQRELRAVGGFVDGWIVARLLFGGPAYGPLDELAFARQAGVLDGLIAARSDRQLGGCLAVWRDGNPEMVRRYETWRAERYEAPR